MGRALAEAYDRRSRGENDENQAAAGRADQDAMETIDDLIGDGLSPQMVEDLMSSTGALYRSAALRAVRRQENLTGCFDCRTRKSPFAKYLVTP